MNIPSDLHVERNTPGSQTLEDHDRQMATAANREQQRAEQWKMTAIVLGILIPVACIIAAFIGYRYAIDQVNQCIASLGTNCP